MSWPDWPATMTVDDRAHARKLVRAALQSSGNRTVFELVHGLALKPKIADRLTTPTVCAALTEMAEQGIVVSHIDPRGVERWRVGR